MAIRIESKADPSSPKRTFQIIEGLHDAVAGKVKPSTVPRRPGRPPSGKVLVTLRLSPEVVDKFKATGPGWQAKIDETLKAAKL